MRHPSKAAVAAVAVASAIVLGAAAPLAGAAGAPLRCAKKAKLGMSAPAGTWDKRVKEVGSGLQARRIFLGSFTASLKMPTQACQAGMYPVISFKTGSYTWAQVAHGKADAKLRSMAKKLAALPCNVFVAVHHEPYGDGTAEDLVTYAGPCPADCSERTKVSRSESSATAGGGQREASPDQGPDRDSGSPRSVIAVSDVIAGRHLPEVGHRRGSRRSR